MKIKMIIVALVATVSLQGAQYREGSLADAIELSLNNRRNGNYTPVIFYGDCYSDTIPFNFDEAKIQNCMDNAQEKSALLISDVRIKNQGKGREVSEIIMGKKVIDSKDKSLYVRSFQNNTTKKRYDLNNYSDLITALKKHFVILNMKYSKEGNIYFANVCNDLLNQKSAQFVAIVGPEYNGVNIKDLCVHSGIKPIVFNGPIVWWKNHLKKLVFGGLSLAAFFGIFCYLKFTR